MVQIEIIGNLGADVREVNYNGTSFYTFNICDNRKVNNQEVSQWFGCNLNRKSEILQYLVKGQQVFVRGVPSFRIFDSKQHHTKMVAVDVFVNEIQLVGAAPKAEAQEGAQEGSEAQAGATSAVPESGATAPDAEGANAPVSTEADHSKQKRNGKK